MHHSRLLLYADDIRLYREIESAQDRELFQEYVNYVAEWCVSNFLRINPLRHLLLPLAAK